MTSATRAEPEEHRKAAMFKTAFSTVACPDWTLDQVAQSASEWGFDGVELRTFGPASTQFACDPAMTSPEKVRRILGQSGVDPAVVASSVGFAEPIRPALIGRVISDTERSVRDAKAAIDLATKIECPLVRVFGFEHPAKEKRASAVRRVSERLALAADAARHTGVRLVIENGGSFNTAKDLMELIDNAGSDLVGAAYSFGVGAVAQESAAEAVKTLGDRLWVAKLRDRDEDHQPCAIGEGELHCADAVAALSGSGFSGWLVLEWDRAWVPGLAAAESVLPADLQRVFQWAGLTKAATARG